MLGPRYRELLDDIFNKKVLARISACTFIGRRRPTRRSRLPAATPSTCCRRCRICRAAQDWANEAETYRRAIAAMLGSQHAARPPNTSSRSRVTTPLDFHDRLSSFRGAGFGLEPMLTPERLVPSAQPQRRGDEPLSGRRRHPSRRRTARRARLPPYSRQASSPMPRVLPPDRSFADACSIAPLPAAIAERLADFHAAVKAAADERCAIPPSASTRSAGCQTTRSISAALVQAAVERL